MPEPGSSRASVLRTLKVGGHASVDQVAEAAELSKNAARVQLLKLESEGAVRRVAPPQTGTGRPPLTFALTAAGHARFPDADGAMLTELLDYLSEAGHDDLLRVFFERQWAQRRAALAERVGTDAPLPDKLRALRALLKAGDFMPQIRQRKHKQGARHVRVRACHCPFPGAVAATRLPCQLERQFLADVLGAPPTAVRLATLAEPACDFDFVLPA